MRNKLFFSLLALSMAGCYLAPAAHAQYGPAKGECLLRDGRQLVGTARIVAATNQAPSTFLYYEKNQPQEMLPAEIRTCQVGKHHFITSGGFVAPDDNGGLPVEQDFIEIIDTTSRVQVFAYTYERYTAGSFTGNRSQPFTLPGTGPGGTPGPGGAMGSAPSFHTYTLYLLRAKGSRSFMPYDVKYTQGLLTTKKELTNQADAVTLQTLFADDPVLQQEILAGKIREKSLPEVVAAYNQGVRRKAP